MTLPPITLQPGQSITISAASGAGGMLDPGWPKQIDTGHMSAIPSYFTNFSPATPSGTGEWEGNLVVAPDGKGLRVNYPTNVAPGNSPVRFGTGIKVMGTGGYYQRMALTFMGGWVFPGANLGIKLCEPRTTSQGSGAGATENHVIGTWPIGSSTVDDAIAVLLQGPNNQARNLYTNQPPATGLISDGKQHIVEVLFTPESVPGAGDGGYKAAVDAVLVANYSNVVWIATGQKPGWPYLMFDPTYGGKGTSPPFAEWWEFDELVVETN